MFKKIISLTIAATLAFGSSVFAAEDNQQNIEMLDQYLSQNGYPQELIDIYEPEQKQDLYNQGAVFVSYDVKGDNIKDTAIKPLDLDSSNNFSHYLSVSQVKSNTGTVQFAVNYNWDWVYAPDFTLEDQWAIAWSDGFQLVDGTSRWTYKAFGRSNLLGEDTNGGTTNYGGVYTVGAGLVWKANLVNGWTRVSGNQAIQYKTYRHKGWSAFNIKKGHDGSNKVVSSGLSGMYFHKFVNVNGSVSFGGGSIYPSISITPQSAFDSSKNSATRQFDWKQANF